MYGVCGFISVMCFVVCLYGVFVLCVCMCVWFVVCVLLCDVCGRCLCVY